jgi:hypothetical protein
MNVSDFIKSRSLNSLSKLTGMSRVNLRRLRDGARPRPETLARFRAIDPNVQASPKPLDGEQAEAVYGWIDDNCADLDGDTMDRLRAFLGLAPLP